MISFYIDTTQVLSVAVIIVALAFPVRVSPLLIFALLLPIFLTILKIFPTCRQTNPALMWAFSSWVISWNF